MELDILALAPQQRKPFTSAIIRMKYGRKRSFDARTVVPIMLVMTAFTFTSAMSSSPESHRIRRLR